MAIVLFILGDECMCAWGEEVIGLTGFWNESVTPMPLAFIQHMHTRVCARMEAPISTQWLSGLFEFAYEEHTVEAWETETR